MQTDTRTEKIAYNRQEQIDLTELLDDSLRCLKRYWIQFLLIIIVVTAMAVTYFNLLISRYILPESPMLSTVQAIRLWMLLSPED